MADPTRRRPAATITPYRDGPYLLRGDFELLDGQGNAISLARRTIALCRCGKSQMRPFCDGTHKLTGFRAAAEAENALAPRPTHEPDVEALLDSVSRPSDLRESESSDESGRGVA